ncbi:MAG TPA: AMP-binding protein, partial [Verrucomicrobiae bacterium]|nr:AMP-binding protein [Verrucomicrobiae bacterium]
MLDVGEGQVFYFAPFRLFRVMNNLAAAFVASVAKDPGKIALFWGEAEYSYKRLLDQSRWLAGRLQKEFVVHAGDRIGMWLKNCPEFIPSLYGIFQAGAAAVPINNFLKPAEVAYMLRDAGINLLITDRSLAEGVNQLIAQQPDLRVFYIEDFAGAKLEEAGGFQPVARGKDDLAVIIYTSGTTGRPKGAMLSHGNLMHNVESCRVMLEVADFDRFVLL